MKIKILIIGENSYIGNCFINYINKYGPIYVVMIPFVIGGFMMVAGGTLIGFGKMSMFVSHGREILAYSAQQLIPVEQEGIEKMILELSKCYDGEKGSLNFSTPFELAIAVMLSAQCTDDRVNKITPILFEKYLS